MDTTTEDYAERPNWDATTARRALEPLANLARLHIRDQRPDAAVAVLESLLNAIRHAGTAEVDHRSVHLDQETLSSPDARRHVHRWLWTVVVADGIRALARADRWDDALNHAERHHGIGTTLLDGRQTAVVAYARRGEHDAVRAALEQSAPTSQWQRAVHACLDLATRKAVEPPANCPSAASRSITRCTAEPLHFRTYLVLTVADLVPSTTGHTGALANLTNQVVESRDASLAGTLLRHRVYRDLPEPVQLALHRTYARTITPTDAREQLGDALNRAPHNVTRSPLRR